MGERERRPEEMATTSAGVTTVTPPAAEEPSEPIAVITLRPHPHAADRKKVVWTEDTVDNENMNKKKSKCCCIYEKPRKFGESDSEESSDDECEHCFGHVDKKKKKGQHTHTVQPSLTITEEAPGEPTVSVSLQPAPAPAPSPPDRPPHQDS